VEADEPLPEVAVYEAAVVYLHAYARLGCRDGAAFEVFRERGGITSFTPGFHRVIASPKQHTTARTSRIYSQAGISGQRLTGPEHLSTVNSVSTLSERAMP
jgi:hypothetical protein